MRNVNIDFTGTLTASMTLDEFRSGEREFWHEGEAYTIVRARGEKDGSVSVVAKKQSSETTRDSLREYPILTRFSPNPETYSRTGKVQSRRGKLKFIATEEKPYQPMKHDTMSGYGEKRKKYVR